MKTKYAALLALALSSSLAQAETFTFEYKATITSISEGDEALPSSTLSSADLGNWTTAIGDVVTARVTFDNTTYSEYDPFTNRYFSHYSTSGYTVHFEQSNYTETTNATKSVLVIDAQDGEYGGDIFSASNTAYHYWPETAYTSYEFELTDPTGQALGSTSIDPEAFKTLVPSFNIRHVVLKPDEWERTYLTTSITSFNLVSEVPEPSTYAMLAAGLCLLAWRKKRPS